MIEIYFQDLTKEKQQEIIEKLGSNCNWDVFPMHMIDDEEINELTEEIE